MEENKQTNIQTKQKSQQRRRPNKPKQNNNTNKAQNTAKEPKNELKKPENTNANKRKKTNPVSKLMLGNEPWQKELERVIAQNKRSHQDRLNAYNLNKMTAGKIRITPLGGLGEIGGNMMVLETANDAIIIDAGMSFPSDDMHGVDILIPDFDYLKKIKNKIKALIITHAHEDHIGAIAYLFKQMQFPIYATPLPLGMISNKFEEHGLKAQRKFFRPVEKRKIYDIGCFKIEWIHITHSIIDASALAIQTPAGVIIHTGDFKIDHTPIDGYPTDLNRLADYGDKGVLCLLSDSTNSYKEGYTRSESSVGPTFDNIFLKSKGRVIMSTFSSNIHRVYQAIEYGLKYGRKICVIGRSMERNINTAMELGYINLDQKIFIDAHEINKYNDKDVLIVTTGSQGETMAALYRMATDEHRHVKIKPTDQIIISAKAIPGNEGSVSTVLNFLLKSGANVAYQDFSEIHVSGHAAQEEQKLMIRLVKPKFFLPVHGEYNHVLKHQQTAFLCGIDPRNSYILNDGDQIEITQKYIKKVGSVKTGKIFIDNQINKQISDNVVIDRQKLAESGVVMIIAQINKSDLKLANKPKVVSYGIVSRQEENAFCDGLEMVLTQYLTNAKKEIFQNKKAFENEIRQVLRKHIFRTLKKYPTIVPTIFIM